MIRVNACYGDLCPGNPLMVMACAWYGRKRVKMAVCRAMMLVWCNGIQNRLIRLRRLKKGQIEGIMIDACLWCPPSLFPVPGGEANWDWL